MPKKKPPSPDDKTLKMDNPAKAEPKNDGLALYEHRLNQRQRGPRTGPIPDTTELDKRLWVSSIEGSAKKPTGIKADITLEKADKIRKEIESHLTTVLQKINSLMKLSQEDPPKIDEAVAIETAHQLKTELDSVRKDINALQNFLELQRAPTRKKVNDALKKAEDELKKRVEDGNLNESALDGELKKIKDDLLEKTKDIDLENFSLAIEGTVSTSNLDSERAYRNLERIFWLKDNLENLEKQVNLLQSRYNEIEASGQMTPAYKQYFIDEMQEITQKLDKGFSPSIYELHPNKLVPSPIFDHSQEIKALKERVHEFEKTIASTQKAEVSKTTKQVQPKEQTVESEIEAVKNKLVNFESEYNIKLKEHLDNREKIKIKTGVDKFLKTEEGKPPLNIEQTQQKLFGLHREEMNKEEDKRNQGIITSIHKFFDEQASLTAAELNFTPKESEKLTKIINEFNQIYQQEVAHDAGFKNRKDILALQNKIHELQYKVDQALKDPKPAPVKTEPPQTPTTSNETPTNKSLAQAFVESTTAIAKNEKAKGQSVPLSEAIPAAKPIRRASDILNMRKPKESEATILARLLEEKEKAELAAKETASDTISSRSSISSDSSATSAENAPPTPQSPPITPQTNPPPMTPDANDNKRNRSLK